MRWAAGLLYAPRGDEEAGGGTARATHCGGGTGGGAPAEYTYTPEQSMHILFLHRVHHRVHNFFSSFTSIYMDIYY
jgi:hypothetical protein